jgi:hypothetical protein
MGKNDFTSNRVVLVVSSSKECFSNDTRVLIDQRATMGS